MKLNTRLPTSSAYRIEIRAFNEGGFSLPVIRVFGENIPTWMEWEAWGKCASVIPFCGTGTRRRIRKCSTFGQCEGDAIEEETECRAGNCQSAIPLTDNSTMLGSDGPYCNNRANCCINLSHSSPFVVLDLEKTFHVTTIFIDSQDSKFIF